MKAATVKTVDDVTKAVDELSAEVVWMEGIDEDQRAAIFEALQTALKTIQSTQ